MARLFHDSQYDWSRTVDSFWETERAAFASVDAPALSADETTDVAIIGGGYCGLSAAYHLARAGVDACVLEAGDIGWGASGRNGGFCGGAATWLGPEELKDLYDEDEALAFGRVQIEAPRLVADLAREEGIDLRRQGDGIWTFAHKPSRIKELETQAGFLRKLGVEARVHSAADFEHVVFACAEQFGALHEPVGFGLNPLAYCLGLAAAAERRGARLHADSRVTAWVTEGRTHRLITNAGSLRARRVIIAANGWLPEDLRPELRGLVLPLLSNIIATRPLRETELAAQSWRTEAPASNTRSLLAYLRMTPDKRLLFGGRGDTAGSPAGGRAMKQSLQRYLGRLFPAWRDVELTHSWRGFIAATMRLTPTVDALPDDPSVSFAFGCHGNGVAFMTWAGRALAERIAGRGGDLPAPLRGLPKPFPMPALRLWYLRMRLVQAWIEDALF